MADVRQRGESPPDHGLPGPAQRSRLPRPRASGSARWPKAWATVRTPCSRRSIPTGLPGMRHDRRHQWVSSGVPGPTFPPRISSPWSSFWRAPVAPPSEWVYRLITFPIENTTRGRGPSGRILHRSRGIWGIIIGRTRCWRSRALARLGLLSADSASSRSTSDSPCTRSPTIRAAARGPPSGASSNWGTGGSAWRWEK